VTAEATTYLDFTHCTVADSIDFWRGAIEEHRSVLGRSWTAAWMPNGGTLEVHFFAIAKRIAALGTTRTSRMEMMIVACLKDFAADVTVAIGALDTKRLLVVFLAIRMSVLAHVLATEDRSAHHATKTETTLEMTFNLRRKFDLPEAPNVPLPIEGN